VAHALVGCGWYMIIGRVCYERSLPVTCGGYDCHGGNMSKSNIELIRIWLRKRVRKNVSGWVCVSQEIDSYLVRVEYSAAWTAVCRRERERERDNTEHCSSGT
jgi:hypothetical protein